MKLAAACAFLAFVTAVPLAKITQKSKCCIVDPSDPGNGAVAPQDCHCFGNYQPSPMMQQCLMASPPFPDDRLKRAWQVGCWCVNEKTPCQEWCAVRNTQFARILKVNPNSGANTWYETTVGAEVRQPVDMGASAESRIQCLGGCMSRGVCNDKMYTWAPTPEQPKCPPLPVPMNSAYGGDVSCAPGKVMAFGEYCMVVPTAGNWCSRDKIECIAGGDGYTVMLDPPATPCKPITKTPTKDPTQQPTANPTFKPTAQPTKLPTMAPIAAPTYVDCSRHNGVIGECDGDTALQCSYYAPTTTCNECAKWTGTPTCAASSKCGLNTLTNACQYCANLSTDVDCNGSSGCTWSGTACY
jgi:hypothetical protein